MRTFKVLIHGHEHAVDIVKLMGDIDAYRHCINEDDLGCIEHTTQPFTMDFQAGDMHVRIITNENNAFIVEKSGMQFEPDRANESTDHFLRRALTINEMTLVDNMLFSGQVLIATFYGAWIKASQGKAMFTRVEHWAREAVPGDPATFAQHELR